MSRDYIELDLQLLHVTGDAIYLSDGCIEDWVPRSLVKHGQEYGVDDLKKIATFEMEEWIAVDKGLE